MKIAGFIERKMITTEFDLQIPEGANLKKLFKLVDKSGKVKGKVMKRILSMPRPPTVLVNGEPVDVPEELGRVLRPGDEISIMTPVAGG